MRAEPGYGLAGRGQPRRELAAGVVSPHDAEALYARAGEPKELWRVPDAGHVVAEFVEPEVYDARVTGLFTRALEEPAAPGP